MLRLAELALFLSPLAAYAIWRLTAGRGGPSMLVIATACVGLAALGAGLAWFALREAMPPGQRYVPAEMRNGRIVPGHTAAP